MLQTDSPKSWHDLPNEIKTICINEMDFKTKIALKLASKSDKILVESISSFERVTFEAEVVRTQGFMRETLKAHYKLKGENTKFGTEFCFTSDDFDMATLKRFFTTTKIGLLSLKAYDNSDLPLKEAAEIVDGWPEKLHVSAAKFNFRFASSLEMALIKKCKKLEQIHIHELVSVDLFWEPFRALLTETEVRTLYICDFSRPHSVATIVSNVAAMEGGAVKEIFAKHGQEVLRLMDRVSPNNSLMSIGSADLFRDGNSGKLYWRWVSNNFFHVYFVDSVDAEPAFDRIALKWNKQPR